MNTATPSPGLGANVRRRREQLKITQAELADRLNVHAPYISDVERGIRTPFLRNLFRLAEALETTPEKLLKSAVDLPAGRK